MRTLCWTISIVITLWLWVPAVSAQMVDVTVDGNRINFGPGDSLRVLGRATTPPAGAPMAGPRDLWRQPVPRSNGLLDVFFAIRVSTGELLFVDPTGAFTPCALDEFPACPRLFEGIMLPPGFDSGFVGLLNARIPGTESGGLGLPAGPYTFFLALTAAGTPDLVALDSTMIELVGAPVDRILGPWSGTWTNTTFGVTGGLEGEVREVAVKRLSVTVDLNGPVFPGFDPPPFPLDCDLGQNPNVSCTVVSPFHQATLMFNADGTFDGDVTTAIGQVEVTGMVGDGQFDMNYVLKTPGGAPFAQGVATATRAGTATPTSLSPSSPGRVGHLLGGLTGAAWGVVAVFLLWPFMVSHFSD